jgi:hypothetical protein
VTPIVITGTVPVTVAEATIDYSIAMPGFILAHGQVTPTNGAYTVVYDPVALHGDFPNLDLVGRDDFLPGLADTVSIALLLQGKAAGQPCYRGNSVVIQGEQVLIVDAPARPIYEVYLPLVLRSG